MCKKRLSLTIFGRPNFSFFKLSSIYLLFLASLFFLVGGLLICHKLAQLQIDGYSSTHIMDREREDDFPKSGWDRGAAFLLDFPDFGRPPRVGRPRRRSGALPLWIFVPGRLLLNILGGKFKLTCNFDQKKLDRRSIWWCQIGLEADFPVRQAICPGWWGGFPASRGLAAFRLRTPVPPRPPAAKGVCERRIRVDG